jgi:YbbR domain-containing protein
LPEKETTHSRKGRATDPKQNSAAILITCMGIAVLLLITNKMSHHYIGELHTHVNYVRIPEGNILSGKTTQQLTLQIKTTGLNLLWMKFRKNKTEVDINLSKFSTNRNFILASYLKTQIAAQIPKEYELISIQPDTLFYGLDKKFTKSVPVVFKSNLEFEKQYALSGKVLLTPKEVKISGPRKEVTEIEEWETEVVTYQKLKENKEGSVSMKKSLYNGIIIEPERIQYKIIVEEYTEKEVEVEIKAINVPKKTDLVLYPKKVKITCLVAMNDFDKVQASQFKAVVDFADYKAGQSKYFDIQITKSPDFVKHIQSVPRKAEYIIYK